MVAQHGFEKELEVKVTFLNCFCYRLCLFKSHIASCSTDKVKFTSCWRHWNLRTLSWLILSFFQHECIEYSREKHGKELGLTLLLCNQLLLSLDHVFLGNMNRTISSSFLLADYLSYLMPPAHIWWLHFHFQSILSTLTPNRLSWYNGYE